MPSKEVLPCCPMPAYTTSTAGLSPQVLDAQMREVRAWRQGKLHNFILTESRKINSVSRNDHRIMLRLLVNEARHNDANKKNNNTKWRAIVDSADRECRNASSIMSIAPDPYAGAVAKLSSMMLWNSDASIRQWQYKYNEHEIARRKATQAAVLAQLQRQGGLFLKDPTTVHQDPAAGLQWFQSTRNLVAQP